MRFKSLGFSVESLAFSIFILGPSGPLRGQMNIENKLKLTNNNQQIIGFKEGMFIRFYDQSLYLWQQWVNGRAGLPQLKVLRKSVKKLSGREVLYGGLPEETLSRQGIKVDQEGVVRISFEGVLDLSEWEQWREKHLTFLATVEEGGLDSDAKKHHLYVKVFLPVEIVERVKSETMGSDEWLWRAVKEGAMV